MKKLVGEHIQTLKPYVPGKPLEELQRELGVDDPIKLASNENPLGPSPRAVEAMGAVLKSNHFYPDGASYRMREAIAEAHGVSREEVLTGNGSNEVLTMAVRTFCRSGSDVALMPEYSFAAYGIVSQAQDVEVRKVPVKEGFVNDLDGLLDAVDERTKIVFLANPNNPTGTSVSGTDLRRFLERLPDDVVALVDEAYHEYVRAEAYESALEMRDAHERLIVTRTFSKVYGLAGVRAGYGIAPAEMVGFMDRIREPFNSNMMAQVCVPAALSDREFIERSVTVNEEGRRALEEGLAGLADRGVSWTPSETNFLLVKLPVEARPVYDAMLRLGVIVRPMAGYGLPEHLRISLAEAVHMERCLGALERALDQVEGGR